MNFKPFLLVSSPDLAQLGRDYRMFTERQFQTVLKGGIPFTIHMNDGRKFAVPDASWVTLGNNSLIVMDQDGTPHFLALPTVNTVTFDSHTR